MPIDFLAVQSTHPLAEVARRTGYPVDGVSGDVMVCCPVHDDRTPSMVLHLDTDRYHCFGGGATGEVVQWVCDIYGVGVADAVRTLDRRRPLAARPRSDGGNRGVGGTTARRVADAPDLS